MLPISSSVETKACKGRKARWIKGDRWTHTLCSPSALGSASRKQRVTHIGNGFFHCSQQMQKFAQTDRIKYASPKCQETMADEFP